MDEVGTTFFSGYEKICERKLFFGTKKKRRNEADLHAGLLVLQDITHLILQKTLDLIYKYHNINPNMRGYPSLDDRKGIVELKINELKEISSIFNIANLCFVIEEFNIAQKLYEEIVRRNFPSREIWNNLGVTHFYQALNKADYSIKYVIGYFRAKY